MSAETATTTAVALNRFGLGARPGEADKLGDGARDWLLRQLDPKHVKAKPRTMRGLMDSEDAAEKFEDWVVSLRRKSRDGPVQDGEAMFRQAFMDDALAEISARGHQQLLTDTPFLERLVMFWSNHFAVSIDKPQVTLLAGPFEREAIRPHVLGRFADLLLAVERHPAMLRFLDNAASFGPSSEFATNPPRWLRRWAERSGNELKLGLNENLAREILELHTLGVNGGYTQADVIELAKAITGWTVESRLVRGGRSAGPWGFVWLADAHEPGARRLLGREYSQEGLEQGEAILGDLAMHPSTARFLARKLARHFVADDPPAALVQRLEQRYLQTGGDLSAVYRALIDSNEAWTAQARKLKRPEEFLISAVRATGLPPPREPRGWAGPLNLLGQPALRPGSPAGWSDVASDWIGSDGIWKRVQIAEQIGDRMPAGAEPLALARDALGPYLSEDTAKTMSRAESPQQAVSILLASPEFQWR